MQQKVTGAGVHWQSCDCTDHLTELVMDWMVNLNKSLLLHASHHLSPRAQVLLETVSMVSARAVNFLARVAHIGRPDGIRAGGAVVPQVLHGPSQPIYLNSSFLTCACVNLRAGWSPARCPRELQ